MTTVVEVLAALYDSRQAATELAQARDDRSGTSRFTRPPTELAQARDDPFIRGLAAGIETGLDMAIEALADLPLLAGRCS